MTERKMCKFYNLNIPSRSLKEHNESVNKTSDDEEQDKAVQEPLQPLQIPSHHHKLQYNYCLWFSRRPPPGPRTSNYKGYGEALRQVSQLGSVEQWWGVYNHLTRPADLPPMTDMSLFKCGIKPMWEDPANVNGGKWVVRMKKSHSGAAWEDLCMAMLGEQFLVGPELCGIVISVRFQDDQLAVWHRTSEDAETVTRIRDTIKRVLHLPPSVVLEYKVHPKRISLEPNAQNDVLRTSVERRLEKNLNLNTSGGQNEAAQMSS